MYTDMAELGGVAQAALQDIDGNGTFEIVLSGGGLTWPAGLIGADGPWRRQTIVYMWNGANFVWHSQQYDPAIFRFEAIQDADTATRRGNLDAALADYRAAAFSSSLRSWSWSEWMQIVERIDVQKYGMIYPNAKAMPFDPIEYAQLTAYARYRIMLLYVLHGWDKDAGTVYESLQKKFPPNSPGRPYVELATTFWNQYQGSHDIKLACDKAVDYAKAHPEILSPLGNCDVGKFFCEDHGLQSLRYEPESVCPF
jgi:hypothetical protein